MNIFSFASMIALHGFEHLNNLGKSRTPFLFMIDFKLERVWSFPLNEINSDELLFDVNGLTNVGETPVISKTIDFISNPISEKEYAQQFNIVLNHLKKGNSYLTNLTTATPINTSLSLREVFYLSEAKYKLWYQDYFVVFSPEIFAKIENGKISSYPMKGTIDAQLENAEQQILENKKERAEHATIVDLIRNDLSRVATKIQVEKFRYIDKIKTHNGAILQVSSQISGQLPANYHEHLGDILKELLPAGSISGAPKTKTLDIINEAETYERGFYTGIFGIFDGENLDSGVMIRFIEKQNQQLFFKSGGGITVNSNLHDEYQELVKKVYLPFKS